MYYIFYERKQQGDMIVDEPVAVAVRQNGQTDWRMDAAGIKDFLAKYSHPAFGGQFKDNSDQDWEALPDIFNGSRFWAISMNPETALAILSGVLGEF